MIEEDVATSQLKPRPIWDKIKYYYLGEVRDRAAGYAVARSAFMLWRFDRRHLPPTGDTIRNVGSTERAQTWMSPYPDCLGVLNGLPHFSFQA
jgi:hypothetical protein